MFFVRTINFSTDLFFVINIDNISHEQIHMNYFLIPDPYYDFFYYIWDPYNKFLIIFILNFQILKREWPKNWESFIPDIIGASKTNESLCQNNMIILKLLSEEVFDFSSGQMTQTKAKHLKDTMCSQFSDVFTLCQYVLENSQNAPLVGATLETLLRFLNWIPLGYIFETSLIETLIFKFLNVPMFRNVTLKSLTEIAAVSVPHYDEKFIALFSNCMERLQVNNSTY